MVERQTRKLEVLVPVTGVRVQIPPPTPEFRKRPSGRFFVASCRSMPFFIAIACASWVLQLLVSVAEMRQDAELHVRYGHQS